MVSLVGQTSGVYARECMATSCVRCKRRLLPRTTILVKMTSISVLAPIHTGSGRPAHSHGCRGLPCRRQRGTRPRSPASRLCPSLHACHYLTSALSSHTLYLCPPMTWCPSRAGRPDCPFNPHLHPPYPFWRHPEDNISVGVEIHNHCIMNPKTGRDTGRGCVQMRTQHLPCICTSWPSSDLQTGSTRSTIVSRYLADGSSVLPVDHSQRAAQHGLPHCICQGKHRRCDAPLAALPQTQLAQWSWMHPWRRQGQCHQYSPAAVSGQAERGSPACQARPD